MVADDLLARLEALDDVSFDVFADRRGYRCQLFVDRSESFGEGSGATISEAIEGALEDMAAWPMDSRKPVKS